MPEFHAHILLTIAAMIIAGLIGYLCYLLFRLHKQQKIQPFGADTTNQPDTGVIRQNPAAHNTRQSLSARQEADIRMSLRVLANSIIDDQVSMVEASIRINALLSIVPTGNPPDRYQAFDQLAIATAHIPQFDAWLALSKNERKQFGKEMHSLEQVHGQAIRVAAQYVLEDFAE